MFSKLSPLARPALVNGGQRGSRREWLAALVGHRLSGEGSSGARETKLGARDGAQLVVIRYRPARPVSVVRAGVAEPLATADGRFPGRSGTHVRRQ